MNSSLFQPFQLHDLTLKNRIALSPMTRGRAGAARLANRLTAEYYAQRSSAGLVITEGTTISEEADGWNESPGIYTDEMTEAWKQTTNAVHERGGVIFLQLWHTGRASHSSFHGGKPSVAPSPIKIGEGEIHTPTGKHPYEVPRALEASEIPRVVDDYRRAAERAKRAGFDGVEIHGANGYLIDEFRSRRRTNARTSTAAASRIVTASSRRWSKGSRPFCPHGESACTSRPTGPTTIWVRRTSESSSHSSRVNLTDSGSRTCTSSMGWPSDSTSSASR
jgi:N-ethylmaleimide reductase